MIYTLLLVDDSITNLRILEKLLKKEDFNILSATNAQETMNILSLTLPNLILMDVSLPDVSGIELCAMIKEKPELKDIPVIFCSAFNEYDMILKGFEVGGVDFISKPFNYSELVVRLRTHLKIQELTHDLQAKNEEKESLLHVLSHDMANPLHSIMGYLELMKRNNSPLDEKQLKYFANIENLTIILQEIITNVRGILAIDSGKTSIQTEPVKINKIITNSQHIFHEMLKKKDLEIITIPAEISDDFLVMAEPVSLQNSVINNLLSNAIKFSYPGDKIIIETIVSDDKMLIKIKDNGMGIIPAHLEKIFCTKESTSTMGTKGEKGTGFGMPLVQKFVSLYGGEIKVSSRHIKDFPDAHGTEIELILKRTEN